MTTFSFYLLLYIVGIVWCKWSFMKVIKDKLWKVVEDKLDGEDPIFYANILSWIPIINLMIAYKCTKKIIFKR